MAFAQFPEPDDLDVDFVSRTGDSRPKTFQQYTVANPHPGFGKDPNIMNEMGHTKFPMWVFSKIENKRIIVENEMELAQHTDGAIDNTLKTDGPTVEEYVKAGYKASEYPPKGYASKSSKEEISAAVALKIKPTATW